MVETWPNPICPWGLTPTTSWFICNICCRNVPGMGLQWIEGCYNHAEAIWLVKTTTSDNWLTFNWQIYSPWRGSLFHGTERNTRKTQNSYVTSLQRLIFMSCMWLNRACRAPHAGTLVARILVSGKNWKCKHEGRSRIWLTLAVTLTLTPKFQKYEYQHVGLVELYPVIRSSWRSDTAVRTYIAVPCFLSVSFRSVK